MESISSTKLKDLFITCPRLKSKLSGQELRAISDTIDKRVRMKYGQLLVKIARLEMYQSAFNAEQTRLPTKFNEVEASTKLRSGEKDMIKDNISLAQDPQNHGKISSNQTRITFALPPLRTNDESTENVTVNRSRSLGKSLGKISKTMELCKENEAHKETSTTEEDKSSEVVKCTEGMKRATIRDTRHCVLPSSVSLLRDFNDSVSDKLSECVHEKDKLIKNFTKEIDFMKTILDERSDYDQIVNESLRQQHLINQLRVELNSKRKDNVDLMKDIQRMKYALSYSDHPCCKNDELGDRKTRYNDDSKGRLGLGRGRRNVNDNDPKIVNASSKKRNNDEYHGTCCDSVLVSSQFLLVGCDNPSDCPWRKQLASCRSVLAKKYQENASLNFMLNQTQERLSRLKVKSGN